MHRIFIGYIFSIIALPSVLVGMGLAAETGRAGHKVPGQAATLLAETPRAAGASWGAGPDGVIKADLLAAMQCLAPPANAPVAASRHFHRSWPYFDTSHRPHADATPFMPPRARPLVVRIVWQKKTRRRGLH